MNKTFIKQPFSFIYHCHQCFTTAKICLVHIHVFIEQNLVLKNNKWLLKKTCTFSTDFKGMFHFSMALYTKSLTKNRKQLDSSTREKPSHNGSVLQFTKLRNATFIRHIWPKQKIHNIHTLNIKQCV